MSRNPEVVAEQPTLQELFDYILEHEDDLAGFVLTYVTEKGHGGTAFGTVSGIALAHKLANRYADAAFDMAEDSSTVDETTDETPRHRMDN